MTRATRGLLAAGWEGAVVDDLLPVDESHPTAAHSASTTSIRLIMRAIFAGFSVGCQWWGGDVFCAGCA